MATSRPATAILLLAILAPILVQACSSAARHRVLAFLVDGYPDPDAPAESDRKTQTKPTTTANPGRAAVAEPTVFVHEPFAKRNCSGCHRPFSSESSSTPEKGLCAGCHGDVTANLRFAHGPVAVNACLECHNPHSSPHQGMTLEAGAALCFRCHESDELSQGEHHAEIDSPSVSCLKCHAAHGGETPMFLKQGAR